MIANEWKETSPELTRALASVEHAVKEYSLNEMIDFANWSEERKRYWWTWRDWLKYTQVGVGIMLSTR